MRDGFSKDFMNLGWISMDLGWIGDGFSMDFIDLGWISMDLGLNFYGIHGSGMNFHGSGMDLG